MSIKEFLSDYGFTILYAIGTAVFGVLGTLAKKLYDKYADTKTKREVVDTAIKAVEQIYTDLHGADKLAKAMQGASEMLAEKGITISELELTMIIEAAVHEMNAQSGITAKEFKEFVKTTQQEVKQEGTADG